MNRFSGAGRILAFLTVGISMSVTGWSGTLTLLTSRAGLPDSVNWGQLGPNSTILSGSFTATSANGNQVAVSSANGAMIFTSFSELVGPNLWDANSGPITLTFSSAVSAVVFNIAPDYTYVSGTGPFSAQLTAFNGATNLGSVTAGSSSNFANVFLGVSDTVTEITSIQIDGLVEANHQGLASTTDAHDFAINGLSLSAPAVSGVPEPSSTILAAGGALLLAFLRRRAS